VDTVEEEAVLASESILDGDNDMGVSGLDGKAQGDDQSTVS
jgi:hypothetical protein